MTHDQIGRVKRSFSALMPRADRLTSSLYDRLFRAEPALRGMFGSDLTEQRRKLMLTLSTVVYELDNLAAVLPSVTDLAQRHVAYGVLPHHYDLVGDALLSALEDVSDGFEPVDKAAWTAAYALLSGAMIAEAYPTERTNS